MMKTRRMLTVVGNDKPGIIAAVTGSLYRTGCNLEAISMTILDGQFAMILGLTVARGREAAVENGLGKSLRNHGLALFWSSIRPQHPLEKSRKSSKALCVPYLLTAIGKDRTGIVYHLSSALAKESLNITDLNSKILSSSGKPKDSQLYALALEFDIPEHFNVRALERRLQTHAKTLGVELTLKGVEALQF